jgi:hypothetical protein
MIWYLYYTSIVMGSAFLLLLLLLDPLRLASPSRLSPNQGDQIGRIFLPWGGCLLRVVFL